MKSFRLSKNRSCQNYSAIFRPEFLNRVDDIVLFKPLTLAELKQIVALQLNLLQQRLAERFIELELTEAAQARLAKPVMILFTEHVR